MKTLPNFQFETGICVRNARTVAFRLCPSGRSWHLIGRLEDGTPFNLSYSNTVTAWTSPARLGEGLRKKILTRLREEIRYAATTPAYVTEYDYTLQGLTPDEEDRQFSQIFARWHREVWRGRYLGDRDEDYIELRVPFAENQQAQGLGAQFDGTRRLWRVHRSRDLSAFARWIPTAGDATPASSSDTAPTPGQR